MNLERILGIKRISKAILYSFAGFKAAWQHEQAFRQEVAVLILLLPLIMVLPIKANKDEALDEYIKQNTDFKRLSSESKLDEFIEETPAFKGLSREEAAEVVRKVHYSEKDKEWFYDRVGMTPWVQPNPEAGYSDYTLEKVDLYKRILNAFDHLPTGKAIELLYRKHYSDLARDDFNLRMGLVDQPIDQSVNQSVPVNQSVDQPVSVIQVLLLASIVLVLIVEILNSAIEAMVDRIGLEQHELSGRAKDLGSAAVMLAITLAVITWFLILI